MRTPPRFLLPLLLCLGFTALPGRAAPSPSPQARAAALGVQAGQTWRIQWTTSKADTVTVRVPPFTTGDDRMQFFEWSAALKKKNALTFRRLAGSVFFNTDTEGRSDELLYHMNTLIVTFVPFSGGAPFACYLRVTEKILPGQTRTGVTSQNRPEQIATAQLEGQPGQLKTCKVTRLK